MIGNTLDMGKGSIKGFDLRDNYNSVSGFGGMNESFRNPSEMIQRYTNANKNEISSPTKKVTPIRKNSISEKSEENRKSVESDLKKDLSKFKKLNPGNFGDEFLKPNALNENAIDTIRRLS